MSTTPWPDVFDALLRRHLPLLGAGTLAPATSLPDMGLDSLASVTLLVSLEQEFDIMVPDERLDPDSFATAGALWTMIREVVGDRGPARTGETPARPAGVGEPAGSDRATP